METIQKPLGPPDLLEHEGLTTILGPCPGCDAWQLDYTQRVATSYANWTVERTEIYFPGDNHPTRFEQMPQPDIAPFYAVIERALEEHMAECPHLRDLVNEYE